MYLGCGKSCFFEGYRLKTLRSDTSKGNLTKYIVGFYQGAGISINTLHLLHVTPPPCTLDSNGLLERLVKEHWTRAPVLHFETDLPKEFWIEPITPTNWLSNGLLCNRIGNKILILEWYKSAIIDFITIREFGAYRRCFRE